MSGASIFAARLAQLEAAWARLSRRERVMLGLAAVAAAGVAAWPAVVGLQDWREDAAHRARRAASDHAAVLAVAAQVGRIREQAGDEALEPALRRLAEARGLTLSTLSGDADGAMTATVEAGSGAAVFAWLAEVEAHGATVRAFTAVSNPDAAVQARVTVSR